MSQDERKPERLVVLTFDDAVSNHATFVAPLLQRYGFGATFFVCEFPPDFATNKQQYMTWEQIAGLHAAGFEIGNHTLAHTGVHNLPAAELEAGLDALDARCAAFGIPKTVTFAYPGGGATPEAANVLRRKGFRYSRTAESRPYDPLVDDPMLVPCYSLHGEDTAPFYAALAAGTGGRIPVLLFHGVPEYTHPWVNTPPQTFAACMKHLAENGYTVIALRDLSRYGAAKE